MNVPSIPRADGNVERRATIHAHFYLHKKERCYNCGMDPFLNATASPSSNNSFATPTQPVAPIAKVEPVKPAAQVMPKRHTGVGPIVGALLIVILLAFGALYFWGAHLNALEKQQPLPLIPGTTQQ